MSSEEFLCARCARHMKTCCQTPEIYVTPGDAERIGNHLGRRDFWHFRVPRDPVYLEEDDDPVWQEHIFREDNSRRVLKKTADNDCSLLGPQGCTLPLEVRPLVCRLYPFDYDERGIRDELAGGCPVELLRPGQQLLVALDMKIDDARRWHKQLYEEIRVEKTSQQMAQDEAAYPIDRGELASCASSTTSSQSTDL
jgi:Fe-S-cluster containining protein